jgi:hypothetical protein
LVQYNGQKFEGKLDANMPLKHGVRSYFEYSKLAREGVLASSCNPSAQVHILRSVDVPVCAGVDFARQISSEGPRNRSIPGRCLVEDVDDAREL